MTISNQKQRDILDQLGVDYTLPYYNNNNDSDDEININNSNNKEHIKNRKIFRIKNEYESFLLFNNHQNVHGVYELIMNSEGLLFQFST